MDHLYTSDDLVMIICIDIETLFKEKRGNAISLIDQFSKIKHASLINIQRWWYIQDKIIFVETDPPLNSTQYNKSSFMKAQQY